MKRTVVAVGAMLLLSQNAAAGWYRVENYQGTVGPAVIQLSLQTYEFGSGITVEGSYFIEGENRPVVIYGQDRDGRLELCEISDDGEFERILVQGSATPVDTSGCPIVLDIDDGKAIGTWQIGGESHSVKLKRVASLDDTGAGAITGTVAIPFWHATASHRFSGVYTQTDSGICMQRLQVINRATSQVDQEIAFEDDDLCSAGTVMTQIYQNVETYRDSAADVVSVNFADGRMGYAVDYLVDPVTGLLSRVQ